MPYDENTKIGRLWQDPAARAVIARHLPFPEGSDTVDQVKGMSLALLAGHAGDDWLEPLVAELAALPVLTEARDVQPEVPFDPNYEDGSVAAASARVVAPATAPRWDVFEIECFGPEHGNPFTDVYIEGEFTQGGRVFRVPGFYDGGGVYRIRFMPDSEGEWSYTTASNARSLDRILGAFTCTSARGGVHGLVRVADRFHFRYADGTRYRPIGTTCYAWAHQGDAVEEQTIATLAKSPFSKLRMCVFPKAFVFNDNEPEHYPF